MGSDEKEREGRWRKEGEREGEEGEREEGKQEEGVGESGRQGGWWERRKKR